MSQSEHIRAFMVLERRLRRQDDRLPRPAQHVETFCRLPRLHRSSLAASAPQEYVERYRGVYDDGPAALRQKRLQAQYALGLVNPGSPINEPYPSFGYNWSSSELREERRIAKSRKMEFYAAMVRFLTSNLYAQRLRS